MRALLPAQYLLIIVLIYFIEASKSVFNCSAYPETATDEEVHMEDLFSNKALCSICKEEMTSIHAEVAGGRHVYLCEKCLESAKQNFIWICMHCGSVFIRPKSLVLRRLAGELKRAYALLEHEQIVQGIDMCIECSPEGVVEYVTAAKGGKNRGQC